MIKPWGKVGQPRVLAESYGRRLNIQDYRHPLTGEIEKFSFYGGAGRSSIVLPITQNNKVLAVRQFRHGAGETVLELPGGKRKYENQSPESVAREELLEETFGYSTDRMVRLYKKAIWIDPASMASFFYPFLALGCKKTGEKSKLDEREIIELVPVSIERWVDMCFDGQVNDAKSIATTCLSLKYLNVEFNIS